MKLSVLARGKVLVRVHEMAHASPVRFVGRKAVDAVAKEADPKAPHKPLVDAPVAWVALAEPTQVPMLPEEHPMHGAMLSEYRREVQEGALWAADEATAKACGVKFDPDFGGEFADHHDEAV